MPKPPPHRYSLSLMERAERCLLDARMSRDLNPSSPAAIAGRVAHEVFDVLALEAYERGLRWWNPLDAQVCAQGVLASPESAAPLSAEVHAGVLAQVGRWAQMMRFYPDARLFLSEATFETPLDGWRFSARIDLLQVLDGLAIIDDYKTGWGLPTQAEVARRLQLPVYAWHVAMALPDVEAFDLAERYTRWGVTRPYAEVGYVDRAEVESIEAYLRVAGGRLDRAWATDDFPADPGPHCEHCTAPMLCPRVQEDWSLPEQQLQDDAAAAALLDWTQATGAALTQAKSALRAYHQRVERPVRSRTAVAQVVEGKREEVNKKALKDFMAAIGADSTPFFRLGKTTRLDIGGLNGSGDEA